MSPLDAYASLIGKTVRVENADNDMLNLVDVSTGDRYHTAPTPNEGSSRGKMKGERSKRRQGV